MEPIRSSASGAPAARRPGAAPGLEFAGALAAAVLGVAAGWLAVARPELFHLSLPETTFGAVALLAALAAAPAVFLFLVRRPAVALAVLVVFVYLNLSEVLVRFHGLPSLLQLLALPLAVAGLRLRGRDGTVAVAGAGPTLATVGYLALLLASTAWALDPGSADERLGEMVKATAVYLLVALLAATPRLLRLAAGWAVAAGSLLAALGVYQAATGAFGSDFGGLARIKQAQIYGEVFEPRIAGPLGDPNYFAQILLVLVPVALALAWGEEGWRGSGGRRRLAAVGAAGLLVAGTMLSYSRGAAVALALVLALAVLVRGVRGRHLAAGAVLLALLASLAPAGFTERLETLGEMLPGGEEVLDPDSSFAKRRLVTATAWRIFVDHPWWGVGAGNYPSRFDEYADRVGTGARLYEEPGERNFPHNLYLEVAAETGALGLAGFGVLVLVAFASLAVARRRLRRAGDTRTAALAEGLGLALVGYLATGLFLHGEFPRYLYLLLGLVAGVELVSRRADGAGGGGATAPVAEAAAPAEVPSGAQVRVRGPVAVLLSRFPLVTETFILREVGELERQGQPVRLVPLIRERPEVVHREAEPWVGRALFTPWISPALLRALLSAAVRRPVRLAGTLARLVAGGAGSPGMLWRSLALVPKAVRIGERLAAEGVGHLHAHFATHPATAALLACRMAGGGELSFSFTVHAHDLFVDRTYLGWKLREAAFVRVISEFNRDYLVERYPWAAGKIEVVHVGVEPERYAPPERESDGGRAATLPVPEETREAAEPVVLAIAALKEYKGLAVLVEACRRLRDEGVRLRCDVVGEGPLRAEIEARAAAAELGDSFRLLGARRQDEVARRVASARLLVLPSVVASDGQMEGIPVALMEALAAERAVVASRLSGIPELVVDGETGLLVPPGDPEALAAAIRRLLEDEALARRLGRAGRAKVEREFRLPETVTRLLVLLDRHVPPPAGDGAELAAAAAGLVGASAAVGLAGFRRGPDAEVAHLLPPGGDGAGEAGWIVAKRHLDRPGASRPAARRAERETAVARRLASWDGAPRPLAADAVRGIVVFARCPGEPMDRTLRRLRLRSSAWVPHRAPSLRPPQQTAGETFAPVGRGAAAELLAAGAAAGRWLARYQSTPLADLLGEPETAEAELETATAGLEPGHPLRGRLSALLAACRPGSLAPAPLHGDFWPGNLLVSEARTATSSRASVRALDFEGAALGPRYRDAAWFLLHADLYLARPGLGRLRRALADAFLAAWLGDGETPDAAALGFFRAAAARRLLARAPEPGLLARRSRRLLARELRRATAGGAR